MKEEICFYVSMKCYRHIYHWLYRNNNTSVTLRIGEMKLSGNVANED